MTQQRFSTGVSSLCLTGVYPLPYGNETEGASFGRIGFAIVMGCRKHQSKVRWVGRSVLACLAPSF